MRTMYDSVNPSRIPRDAEIVAGYVNGIYKWADSDWALFPNAVHVGIAVRASYDGGEVLDVEIGDATPAEAPGWVTMRRSHDVDPSIYCNLSTWPTVVRAFQSAGVVEPHYWIAHYDGSPTLPVGAVAKQYQNTPGFDVSSVADFWPGIDTGDKMTLTNADADVVVNRFMERLITVGPEDGPTQNVFFSALLRLIDDNASVVRNTLTETNVKQWIREVLAEQISITGTVEITGK